MRDGRVRARISRRDLALMALVFLSAVFLFGAGALFGSAFFWGDLLYLHHPWKALASEMVLGGTLPLWNPYIYLGMPLAAELQCAAWYPGSIVFYLFDFSTALALFHCLHYGTAGVLMFLWLRRIGISRCAAAAGAAVFMLCGGMISQIPFLNHLSTITFFPAFLLLAGRTSLLAVSFAMAFLSGYPTMLVGEIFAAWMIDRIFTRDTSSYRVSVPPWGAAAALSLGLSACLLLPAAQLAATSKRGEGMGADEKLTWSFKTRDLIQLTAPPLVPREEYSPTVNWWKTAYFGIAGWAAALLGLSVLGTMPAAAAVGYILAVLLVLLGESNPISEGVWTYFPPLHFVRYPGNMAYLLTPMVAALAAFGLHLRKWARIGALVIAGELAVYAVLSQPKVGSDYFTDSGPLVRILQQELQGHRYLLSPLALHWSHGVGPDAAAASRDLKHRLYGLTNSPYHLASVGNFGEPLVPKPAYDFMDHIFSRPSLADAARWLDWADVNIVMTRDPQPAGQLRYLGNSLWHMYQNDGTVSRAYWFNEESGAKIPRGLGASPPDIGAGRPVALDRPRADRFEASGESREPGWLFISEPLGPGWQVDAQTIPALRAFHRIAVPAGPWRVRFRYDPASWRIGRWVTLLFLGGLAAYWYNHLLAYIVGRLRRSPASRRT